jgi:hypothetical protein
MAPDKRKGEQSIRDAAAEEGRRQERRPLEAADPDADAREEDGWTQPESSAQKGGSQEPEE